MAARVFPWLRTCLPKARALWRSSKTQSSANLNFIKHLGRRRSPFQLRISLYTREKVSLTPNRTRYRVRVNCSHEYCYD